MATVLRISQDLTPDIFHSVTDCIERGGVIAVATESSYALAASVRCIPALERITKIKGDRNAKPILLLVSSQGQVRSIAGPIPRVAERLMDRFWPGPLTLVLPAAADLSGIVTGGTETIGVRQPGCPQLLSLLDVTGPLTGTSANRSGGAPADTAEAIVQEFGDEIDLVLDTGSSPGGNPSTIVSVVDEIQLLRRGPVSSDLIQNVLAPFGARLHDLAP
ncbi:MAG: threonylcarbamoyl-AMP synthase [Nitrospirales bacterium]|nr:threonylcarbamoyl-AMP synthase [Nitrospira sp.]MDR4501875.1 threonylcarbamoyl-AMP synthase [Nitrospirales bacterium]